MRRIAADAGEGRADIVAGAFEDLEEDAAAIGEQAADLRRLVIAAGAFNRRSRSSAPKSRLAVLR